MGEADSAVSADSVQLLDSFGVTSTGKVTEPPSLELPKLSLTTHLCARALLGPWGLHREAGAGVILASTRLCCLELFGKL